MRPRLAILAYPTFGETDRSTIQSIRARYDPQFSMLDPHFTLVFPVEAPTADVIGEARSVASATAPFSVALCSVRAVPDVLRAGGHVYLVAEQGAREIAGLNSRLYGGLLNCARRADIPYLPHITVAACADFSECQALAAALAPDRWDIRAFVGALAVVEIVGAHVATVATVPLGAGS